MVDEFEQKLIQIEGKGEQCRYFCFKNPNSDLCDLLEQFLFLIFRL